jgi:hypothetical protein
MRLVGIIAVFVLTVTAIVEGAALVRLSNKVDSLSEQLKAEPPRPVADLPGPAQTALAASAALAAERARPPVPKLNTGTAPNAEAPSESAPPATGILREALASPEGREHLKNAMELLREQQRQQRLVEDMQGDMQQEQRYRERLARVLGLAPSEQGSIGSIYSQLQTSRQKVLDEMRSGQKSAEQADEEIDTLEGNAERQVQGLLGDTRMKQLREARRAERQQRREERRNAAGQATPPPT